MSGRYESSEFSHLPQGKDIVDLDEMVTASRLALLENTRRSLEERLQSGDILEAQRHGMEAELASALSSIRSIVEHIIKVKSGGTDGKTFDSFNFFLYDDSLLIDSQGIKDLAHESEEGITVKTELSSLNEEAQKQIIALTMNQEPGT